MRKRFWTKEKIIDEAKKYNTATSWFRNSRSSYGAARELGIYKLCSEHMPSISESNKSRIKYTKAVMLKEARKHTTIKEWATSAPGSYAAAWRTGIIEKATCHMQRSRKSNHYYTKENIKKEIKKYKSYEELFEKNGALDSGIIRAGLKDDKELMGHLEKRDGIYKWPKEKVLEDALKYDSIKSWRYYSSAAYSTAWNKGWLNEVSAHMRKDGTFYKRCLYSIKIRNQNIVYIGLTFKYKKRIRDHLKTERFINLANKFGVKSIIPNQLTDYIDVNKAQRLEKKLIKKMKESGYEVLNKNNGGSIGGTEIKWSKKKIVESAKKYKTIKEWRKRFDPAYVAALKFGICDMCTEHMQILRRKQIYA